MRWVALGLVRATAVGCGDKDADSAEGVDVGGGVGSDGGDGGGTTDDLQWYPSCGDPVCGGYRGPFEGLAVCTAEVEGDACSPRDAACDREDECNSKLICTDSDPRDQEGGCPQSQKSTKTEVVYLSPTDVEAARQEVLSMRLARWRYVWEPPGTAPHMGFMIDDVGPSTAVRPDGERVDLYGYNSLTVAALQAQEQELVALRAEMAALRSEVRAMREQRR